MTCFVHVAKRIRFLVSEFHVLINISTFESLLKI